MMTFEDTVIKTKDLLTTAGQKVSDAVTIQKIKLQIAQIKSDINKDFRLLGRLYYSGEKRGNVDAEAIKAMVEEIDLDRDRLREAEAELAFARGDAVCDNCGGVNRADADYCSKCGIELN